MKAIVVFITWSNGKSAMVEIPAMRRDMPMGHQGKAETNTATHCFNLTNSTMSTLS